MSTARTSPRACHRAVGLFATVCIVMLVALGLLAPAIGARDVDGAALVERARRAAEHYDFAGVVAVEWRAHGRRNRELVPVREQEGLLRLGDDPQMIGSGARRLLGTDGAWHLVWGDTGTGRSGSPPVGAKYDLVVRDGPEIAGRSTTVVEARHHGRRYTRFAIDDETGLLLRREQFDDGGRLARAVGFREITDPAPVDRAAPVPRVPRAMGTAPEAIATVEAPFRVPARAGDGFALSGRYRDADGSVQLYYSDGLSSASVFEQLGTLDEGALPRGGAWTELEGRAVHVSTSSVGAIAVWESDGVVYTCVTDARPSELAAMIRVLSGSTPDDVTHRIADFVLEPFRWTP